MLNKSSTSGSSSSEEPPKKEAQHQYHKFVKKVNLYDEDMVLGKYKDFTYVSIDHQSHFDK